MTEVLFEDRILTVPQVAKYLQISRAKAYAMVSKREIPYIRMKRNVRVRMSDLQKWLEERIEKA